MADKIRIFGMAGSLRKGSYNKALLRAAKELVPSDAELDIFDIEGIPAFNEDLMSQMPQKVKELKSKVIASDAVLIATPEYNYSIPGILKNAIDWGSRPYDESCWNGKPVAIMGASSGMLGTARCQYHLRQCFVTLNMFPLNNPEVMVAGVQNKVSEDGKLTDQKTRELIAKLLMKLTEWTRKLKA